MASQETQDRSFAQPTQQLVLMVLVLVAVVVGGVLLARPIETVFFANIYLNAFIMFVFVLGVAATFWQIGQVFSAVNYLRNFQQGLAGHEHVRPPALLASMAPMLRQGRAATKKLATSSTRSMLDSISVRLDESRDITRYVANLLIFLGLLGTFWGLSLTVPAVIETIRSLAPQDGDTSDIGVFDRLMTGLESQLGGMGTAFASSLVGLAGSLVVGLLELFAGHGQNRFYRELEDWLTSFTRLGLVSEGEGPEGALISLLERVDEGLEKTTEFAERAQEARVEAEKRLGATAEIVAQMAAEIGRERDQMHQLISEMRQSREAETGRDHAMLTVLKRIDAGQSQVAAAHQALTRVLDEGAPGLEGGGGGVDIETRSYIRSLDKQLKDIGDDIAKGRGEALTALRAEIRALTNLIDVRTREPGS